MKKKKLLALLTAVSMVLSLAGCAKTDNTPEASTGQESVPDETDMNTEVEPAKEAELNIMMSFPQYMDQWETYCRQFEEKMLNEENIKVKVNLEMPS